MSDWINRWAGSYTFISCSYWAPHYANVVKRILGKGLKSTLFIHKKGTASFLVKKEELDSLGNFLAKKTIQDEAKAMKLLQKLKDNTDVLMKIMDDFEGKILTKEQYESFYPVFERHLAYQVFMKKTIDYLPKEALDRLFNVFHDARLYSEQVYSRTEQFFRSFVGAIAEKEGYDKDILTCLTQKEIEDYLDGNSLPDKKGLAERFDKSAILFEDGRLIVLTGEDFARLEGEVFDGRIKNEVKGVTAFPGKVKGKVRIIYDPFKKYEFDKGDILVAGMTRPEFVPVMEKAAAIVTDAGGILCHAAITAREMKKPCIVGTEIVTKVFKDGDLVEVDADKGIVRKLNS